MTAIVPELWPVSASVGAKGVLNLGQCDVVALEREYGTPLYVFDAGTIRGQCRAYRTAMKSAYPGDFEIHYAGKALLNTAVAQLVNGEGLGLDVVSAGELALALRAGIPASMIALHGNAKTPDELSEAVGARIGHIVINNLDEIQSVNAAAKETGHIQPVMLRVSPEIAVDTHRHISTGQRASKFGLPLDQLEEAKARLKASPFLLLDGLHFHLGSQLRRLSPYGEAIATLLSVAKWFSQRGFAIKALSPGGGLGIDQVADDGTPAVEDLVRTIAGAVIQECARLDMALPKLILEPGRSIVGRAGVAVYRVTGRKVVKATGQDDAVTFIHVNGGMGDNLRPALYGARHAVCLANRPLSPDTINVRIAGRYCESGDIVASDLRLPDPEPGDLIALAGAGAYTLSMASNYNLVPRPAVVLVEEGKAQLIQQRERIEALWARDLPLSLSETSANAGTGEAA